MDISSTISKQILPLLGYVRSFVLLLLLLLLRKEKARRRIAGVLFCFVFLHGLHSQIEGFIIFWILEQFLGEDRAKGWISWPHFHGPLQNEGAYVARWALGYCKAPKDSAVAVHFWGRHLEQVQSEHLGAYFASVMFSPCQGMG